MPSGPTGTSATDAGGPRVEPIDVTGTRVTLTFTVELLIGTLDEGVDLLVLDRGSGSADQWAWTEVTPTNVVIDPGPPFTVAFDVAAAAAPDRTFRISIRGTGPSPLTGLVAGDAVPFAGWVDGPAGSATDGHDISHQFEA